MYAIRSYYVDEAARTLVAPHVVLFDWHATLVDTLDAMYNAVDDALARFGELGLLDHLVPHDECKTPEDARLVDYVRETHVITSYSIHYTKLYETSAASRMKKLAAINRLNIAISITATT